MKNHSVIAVVFTKNRQEVLLIKRRDVPVWVLPGGGIEKDETALGAIIREVKEESGFEVKIVKKIGEYTPVNKLSKFTYLFECEIVSGEAASSSESSDVKFFEVKKLPKLIPPPYPMWIEDGLKNEKEVIQKKLFQVNYLELIKQFFFHPILIVRFLLSKIGITINT